MVFLFVDQKTDHSFVYMGVSKNKGTPEWRVFLWNTLLKLMIWGYHYFWKHPYPGKDFNSGFVVPTFGVGGPGRIIGMGCHGWVFRFAFGGLDRGDGGHRKQRDMSLLG